MATKIRAINIITLQGTKSYYVGSEYNGRILHEIKDKSMEYPDSLTVIYMGFTKEGNRVFEIINAPVDVEYIEVEEKDK